MSYQGLEIDRIFSFTHKDSLNTLKQFCEQADFIFHLAGVNRPEDPSDYELGNRGLTEQLLDMLRERGQAPAYPDLPHGGRKPLHG